MRKPGMGTRHFFSGQIWPLLPWSCTQDTHAFRLFVWLQTFWLTLCYKSWFSILDWSQISNRMEDKTRQTSWSQLFFDSNLVPFGTGEVGTITTQHHQWAFGRQRHVNVQSSAFGVRWLKSNRQLPSLTLWVRYLIFTDKVSYSVKQGFSQKHVGIKWD